MVIWGKRRHTVTGLLMFAGLTALIAQGCDKKPDATSASDAQLRKAFTASKRLEDLPPDQQERVKGFMKMSQSGQNPSSTVASPGANPRPTIK